MGSGNSLRQEFSNLRVHRNPLEGWSKHRCWSHLQDFLLSGLEWPRQFTFPTNFKVKLMHLGWGPPLRTAALERGPPRHTLQGVSFKPRLRGREKSRGSHIPDGTARVKTPGGKKLAGKQRGLCDGDVEWAPRFLQLLAQNGCSACFYPSASAPSTVILLPQPPH